MKISISGIRGIYGNDDLGLHEIAKFSRLFGSFIGKVKKDCLIARDTRPSSNIILRIVIAGLLEQGFQIYNLDVAPTPVVFRESRTHKSAIIVTASHNPLEWNGLKFIVDGRGVFEDELTSFLSGSIPPFIESGELFTTRSNYISDLMTLLEKNGYLNHEKKNIGVDLGGGSACNYAVRLFKMLCEKVYSINDVESISSRTPDPTTDSLSELRTLVSINKLEVGFAFDMDGDRLVIVNDDGTKLTPDSTLLLCVASTLSHGLRRYVTSIDTSNTIENIIKSYGGSLAYSKVGESNVVKNIIDSNFDAGGEGSSGGFILPNFTMCRDGLLAGAIISTMDKKMRNECLLIAKKYTQIRSKIPMNSNYHNTIIEKIQNKFKDSYQLLTLDGIKVLIDDNSWVLIRPSNTEDALRISVESEANNAHLLYKETMEKVQNIYEQIK